MWSLAIIDLAMAGRRSETVDAVIRRLGDVVAGDGNNAAARNDLAVAYLARASLRPDATPLFESLEQIERAVWLDPLSPVVSFNHALILERLHLDEEAGVAWTRFLARDSTSSWAKEALRHREALLGSRQQWKVGGFVDGASSGVVRDPQGAREYSMSALLPTWAEARMQGNRAAADSIGSAMSLLGTLLAAHNGDSSTFHLARIGHSSRTAVVHAASAFGKGAKEFRSGAYARVGRTLAEPAHVLRAARERTLAGWTEVMLAFVEAYEGNYWQADDRFTRIAREAADHGDIALRARALWGHGLSAARQGKTARAVDDYTAASALYRTLGERTNEGTMLAQLADVLFLLGRDDAAMNAKYRALAATGERGDERARTGAFIALGRELAETGLPAAGVAVLRQAVSLAVSTGRPSDSPEALVRLSDAEVAAGRIDAGRDHLKQASTALRAVTDVLMHDRLAMEIAAAEATIAAADAPALAVSRLGTVEEYYRRGHLMFDRGTPLVRKARLELRLADTVGAQRDLEQAAAAIESHTLNGADPNAARNRAIARGEVYRELVALDLARHDTVGAFLSAERGRGNQLSRVPRIGSGVVVLSYLMLTKETVLWILTGSGTRMVRIPMAAERLRESMRSLEASVRRNELTTRGRASSRKLFDVLIAPALPELARARELVVVADGGLSRLPFAAVRDSLGQYLFQRVALVYASAVREEPVESSSTAPSFIIGNPAFDPAIFPELAPLRSAAAEVADVARSQQDAVLLANGAATKPAVISALRSASLVHFAGHARLVERAPMLSHLVLARAGGGLEGNTLSAAEIANLNLRRLRLVILSSCGTTQARSRRDDGESGLAQAFLSAGAHAVISSLWEADDNATATLMATLHRRLVAGDSPAEALRLAQSDLLDSATEGRASSVWSAFRYERR